jgi:transcription elongation factor Elf1
MSIKLNDKRTNNKKRLEHIERVKERNIKLKNISLECPYCHYNSNLLNIKLHLNSKKCQKMKALFLTTATEEQHKTEYKFNIFINDAINKLKNPDTDDEDENQEPQNQEPEQEQHNPVFYNYL